MILSGKIMMMIATTMILPIVLIAGCINRESGPGGESPSPVLFQIALDSMESRTVGSETLWDAYFTITNKDPMDYELAWNLVNPRFMDETNFMLEQVYLTDRFVIGADPGNELHGWYEDLSGRPDNVDILDRIIITGMDASFQGIKMWVFVNRLFICSFIFPDTFV